MKKKPSHSILILLAFVPMNFCLAQANNSVDEFSMVKEENPTQTQKLTESTNKDLNQLNRKKHRAGQWEFYWEDDNSRVSSKGKFRNGKQVGKWTYYSQEGNIERVEINRMLSKKMKTTQYYSNGKVEKTGFAKVVIDKEYINYYWVGKWKCYDESGNFVKTEVYEKGELVEQLIVSSWRECDFVSLLMECGRKI